MDDFLDETKQELVDTFPEYVTDENKFEIPEFQLIHRSIVGKGSHGKSKTKAFKVPIERQHSKVFKHVMELAFAKTSMDEMLFIPFSLKQELSCNEYCTIIQQKSTYLKITATSPSSRLAISVCMNLPTMKNNIFHFNHLLWSKPGVHRIDSTKLTPDKKNYIRQSNTDLKMSIKTGNNDNLSKNFITRQELQDIVQSFTKEMTRQIQDLQNQQGTHKETTS
jgi:hypothetical protein